MKPRPPVGSSWLVPLIVLLAQTATAACLPVAGDAELTIEDLGRVLFGQLTTDRARDQVAFGGGVCLEIGALEVRIEADSLLVFAPGANARVEAAQAVVHAAGWRLTAVTLELDARIGILHDVTLEGDRIVGRADLMLLDLRDGSMRAEGLEVITPTVRLTAAEGVFGADGRLVVVDAVASTCDCPPRSAPIRVEGSLVRLDLASGILQIDEGVLALDGRRIALPPELRLSEADLAALRLPITVAVVGEGRRGWVVGLDVRGDQGGAVQGDVAFGPEADPRWSALFSVSEGGTSVRAEARDGALAIALSQRVPLGEGLDLLLAQRAEGGTVDGRLQDASATLEWRRALTTRTSTEGAPTAGTPTEGAATEGAPAQGAPAPMAVEAQLALTAAVTGQQRDEQEVAHPRGRLVAALTAATPNGPLGQLSVRLEGGATAYGGLAARQSWFGVTPRWRLSLGPLSLDATHTHRTVRGASPFDERVDRLAGAALSVLRLSASAPLGDAARGRATLETRFDWRADPLRDGARIGLERLRLAALVGSGGSETNGPSWEAALTIEAAGIVDPRPKRDAFVRGSFGVAGGLAAGEASVAIEVGLGAVRPGVRSLTLAGAIPVPLADGDVELTPYLALDVWPLIDGSGWPRLSGHGLALRWQSCCGTLDVGYRSLPDGSVTTRLAFEVVPREPSLEQLER